MEEKLPAVSCSSGKLRIEKKTEDVERQYPGRVFENESLSYVQAMNEFVSASQAKATSSTGAFQSPEMREKGAIKTQKKLLHREEAQLRDTRRAVRIQRKAEDVAWKQLKAQRRMEKASTQSSQEKRIRDDHWKHIKEQHREFIQRRHEEDTLWRQKRVEFKERWNQLPSITAWIAILIVLDNCTRQCPGLPIFVEGSKVTAALIVDALQELLPDHLRFVITDRGPQFKAEIFKELLKGRPITHVFIAKRRPQSNGIAERFVRTIKEWLRGKNWENVQELTQLVHLFIQEYNDRPHQGLPISGLSPNEFAKRLASAIFKEQNSI